MKKKKTYSLTMLPSEKASSLFTHIGKIIFSPGARQSEAPGTIPQILCITSAEDMVEPRFIIDNRKGMNGFIHEVSGSYPGCQSIIASSDRELTPKSWIPDSFVKAYQRSHSEGHPIREVDVEVIDVEGSAEKRLKVREDGSVVIRQSRSLSRMEYEKKIFEFNKWRKEAGKLGQNERELISDWIEESLK